VEAHEGGRPAQHTEELQRCQGGGGERRQRYWQHELPSALAHHQAGVHGGADIVPGPFGGCGQTSGPSVA
jgi:hypothetical protein